MDNTDKLKEMFIKQRNLQQKLGNNNIVADTQYIKDMILALIDEATEALRETPWKPWKTNQTYNKTKFREEIIDIWHFLINLSIAADMTSTEVYEMFLKKNKLNQKRKMEGY